MVSEKLSPCWGWPRKGPSSWITWYVSHTLTSTGRTRDSPAKWRWLQTSSIGSLNHSYLQAIYNACQGESTKKRQLLWHLLDNILTDIVGDTGLKEYHARRAMPKRRKERTVRPGHQDDDSFPSADLFRIYFPTEATVESSRGGRSVSREHCGLGYR